MSELFTLGSSYSALNTARSTLSTYLTNDAGVTIGTGVAVKRFMKGVFEMRTPGARYMEVWDATIGLDFLKNFYPCPDLTIKTLTEVMHVTSS